MKLGIIGLTTIFSVGFLFAHPLQTETGVISGRVFGPDGKPAVGVRVAATTPAVNGQIPDTLAAITLTDETGHYVLEKLPKGRYGILAGALNRPTYFPGTSAPSAARIISLAEGEEVDSLNFSLVNPPPSGSASVGFSSAVAVTRVAGVSPFNPSVQLTGRVVMENGTPPPDLSQTYRFLYNPGQPLVNGIPPNPDGTFQFVVNEGEYPFTFSGLSARTPDNFYVKSMMYGVMDLLKNKLPAKANATDEIIVMLGEAPIIPGTVTDTSGQPVSGLEVSLTPIAAGFAVQSGTTDARGNFVIRGAPPAEYRVGGRDITGIGPIIAVGTPSPMPLDLVFSAMPGVRTLNLPGFDSHN